MCGGICHQSTAKPYLQPQRWARRRAAFTSGNHGNMLSKANCSNNSIQTSRTNNFPWRPRRLLVGRQLRQHLHVQVCHVRLEEASHERQRQLNHNVLNIGPSCGPRMARACDYSIHAHDVLMATGKANVFAGATRTSNTT